MKHILPTAFSSLALATLVLLPFTAANTAPGPVAKVFQAGDYAALRARAEALCHEKSWALARDLYQAADALDLAPEDARWVDFRLADCRWRAAAGSNQPDPTELERAQAALQELLRGRERREDHDAVWVSVQESLGDFHWLRAQDWSGGWSYYNAALDHWARSSDLEPARARYLDIVWRLSEAPGYGHGFQDWLPGLPLETVEGALRLARGNAEQARARYLVARVLWRTRGDFAARQRVFRELEGVLELGRAEPYYDDALFALAELHASPGLPRTDERGAVSYVPDFPAAVKLHRRLIAEHAKGATAYYDRSQRSIADILGVRLSVSSGQVFLPGSKVRLDLAWRNLARIDLALYPVDLSRDVRFSERNDSAGQWLAAIDVGARERVRAWSEPTADAGDHVPGSKSVVLEGELAPGAYVVVATGGGESARDLVLVSESALIVESVDEHALAWLTRAGDGRPVAGARVHLWERDHTGRDWIWREQDGTTDADGLARFTLKPSTHSRELFVASSAEGMQAFTQGWNGNNRSPEAAWRLYATTDRPAYRPGESVHWKLVARRVKDAAYSVPQGESLDWRVDDPHGAEVASGTARLNAFGSATGELAPEAAWTLGEYRVTWRAKGEHIGSATLFRLEEYKLPEFRVSVSTPEVPGSNGQKQAFKSGDTVTLEIAAEYYFGGSVSGATAQVLVYRQPYWPRWERERDYPWYFDQEQGGRGRFGHWNSELVTQETRETDAAGKIHVTFATDPTPNVDYEYRVEARVTDGSRREVSGSGSVRVARQRYFVEARPRHNLHRPGDVVTLDFTSQDANGEPVAVEGNVRVSRLRTVEVWTDASGRRFTAEERRRLPDRGQGPGWTLAEQREEHDLVLARLVTTDAAGRAAFAFTAERSGAYRVAWTGRDADGVTVTAETSVFVLDDATTDLAVRHGALDIVLDADTFSVGDQAAVMLVAPSSERYVLFVQHAGDLFDARVVHLTGSVKLVTLAIDQRHVPNVYLQAWMVSDHAVWSDAEEVIVPPAKQFLDVSLATGAAELRPGAEDFVLVTTRDHTGEPVAAEVELALVDEAVLAIQADYAGDPRQFFYGQKRPNRVSFHASFQQRGFALLRTDAEGRLVDERQAGLGGEWREQDGKRDEALGRALSSKMAANAPAPAMEAGLDMLGLKDEASMLNFQGGGPQPALVVRSDFRTTALWEPLVVTGRDGTARVPVRYPESTTRWRATARVADALSRFGQAEAHTRTRLPLMVRLQAPRFFVVGDRCVVSALIDNASEEPLTVRPELVTEGLTRLSTPDALVTIAAGAQARVDWHVTASEPGNARLVVSARAAELADAMERVLPVYEHGIDKLVAKSAKLTAEELLLTLELPRERRAGSTTLDVRVAPSLAVALLDALPYLIEYPYGCVEQTMSRFLPAVITARTLAQLGLAPGDVAGRMFGGIEAAHAGKTHTNSPRDLARLDELVAASLARLVDFQHADGGWGWWKHGESDHFMTSYVLWGLALAREARVNVPQGVLERAAQFLALELVEAEREPDLQAWMLHALAVHLALADARLDEPHALAAADNLWERRDALNAYSRALFALATHHLGQRERARTLVDNLANGVMIDATPDTSLVQRGAGASDPNAQRTAHWGQDGIVHRWSQGSVEATAFCLRALVTIDPQNALVAPVTHWMVRNRRGAQWSNTRDTAISVLALNDYLRASGELATDLDYELWVNGTRLARQTVKPADVIAAPSSFRVPAELVRDGQNEVRLVRTRGSGPLYLGVEARFFSLEEPITPAGNELFARREYVRLAAVPTLLAGTVVEKRPWSEGALVPSGERIEVVLTLEAKNDLEYLILEDLKPAGLEATQLVSGEPLSIRELKSGALDRSLAAGGRYNEQRDYTGRSRAVHQELRDRKVALFIDKLPQGLWEVRYELRAEVPGEFHALPLMGHAMYVPEIRCNGQEVRFRVVDP